MNTSQYLNLKIIKCGLLHSKSSKNVLPFPSTFLQPSNLEITSSFKDVPCIKNSLLSTEPVTFQLQEVSHSKHNNLPPSHMFYLYKFD